MIYHYYWYRDQAESGDEQLELRSCTSSATRTRAHSSASPARACSSPATSRTTPRSSSTFLSSDEGQQALADSYALEYPLNPEVHARCPGQAVRRAGPAAGRPVDTQRPEGDRDDAGRRAALTHDSRGSTRRPAPAPSTRATSLLLAAGCGRRRPRADPARLRRRLHRHHRARRGLATCSCVRGSASCCSNTARLVVGGMAAEHRPRRRLRLAGRAHATCPAAGSGTCCWSHRSPCPAFVNSFGWVSLTHRRRGLRRGAADRDAVVLPARLPPGRGVAARARPGARGGRVLARLRSVAHLRAGRPAAAAPGACSAARCSSGCTCWPSSGRCRCCASRRSRRRSTTSTARRSTARPPTCSRACSCCAAWSCCSPSCGCAGTVATRASAAARPAGRRGTPRAGSTLPALLALAGARRAGARRAARQPDPLARRRLLDGVPDRRARVRRGDLDRARARRRPLLDRAARAAGRLARGAPPQPRSARRSSAAPTSPTRCPASSSRSPW